MSAILSSISSSSKLFTYISKDNRIHLWDTESKKEKRSYVEKHHLSHQYTCFDWKQLSADNLGLFAVGCSDGTIVIWDLVRGIVVTTFKIGDTNSNITSVVFASDATSVFVSDEQNSVHQYLIESGELLKSIKAGKKSIQKLALNPRVDVLAVASSTVRLVDAATGRKKKLETKFSGSVAGMVFSECGCYLAACVSDSHEIFIFDVQATASSSQAFHIASVSGTPVSLVCRSTDQYVEVLCWFEYGDAVIIRYLFSDDASTNNVYTCNLHTNGPVMSACFGKPGDYSASGATLLLGSQSSPTLHAVEYSSSDSETSILESVSIGTDGLNGAMSTDMVKSSSSKSSKKAATATALEEVAATSTVVLGPFETGGKKRPLLVSDSHLNDSLVVSDHDQDDDGLKSKKTRTRKGSIGSVGSLGSAGDDNESIVSSTRKDLELTIEQRLQQLSSVTTQMEQSHARQVASTIEGRSSSAVPSSDSLVVLIEQALQASDDTLLEQCLNTEDSGVIETTARSLPAPRVIPFLLKLTSKLEKRPARGHVLTIWLGSLIKSHASYLIGFPGIAKQLASLSQMLEQRVSTYVKLTSLSGRLDLIMQQTSFQPNVSTSSNSSNGQGHGSQSVSSDGKANSGSGPKQVYYEE